VAAFLRAVIVEGDPVNSTGNPNGETATLPPMRGDLFPVDGRSPSGEIPASELDEHRQRRLGDQFDVGSLVDLDLDPAAR
jgi:hypothetical protein